MTQRAYEFNCPSWLLFIHPSWWLACIQVVTQVPLQNIWPAVYLPSFVAVGSCPSLAPFNLPQEVQPSIRCFLLRWCGNQFERNLQGCPNLPPARCRSSPSLLVQSRVYLWWPIRILFSTKFSVKFIVPMDYLTKTTSIIPAGFPPTEKSGFPFRQFLSQQFSIYLLDWKRGFTVYFSQILHFFLYFFPNSPTPLMP